MKWASESALWRWILGTLAAVLLTLVAGFIQDHVSLVKRVSDLEADMAVVQREHKFLIRKVFGDVE